MYPGIEIVVTNIGIDISTLVFIVSIIGTIVFFAADYRLGYIMALFISALNFILAYKLEENYTYALIVMCICVVAMAFSIYMTSRLTTDSSLL